MAISRGQITIVDLNDAKSLNLYLSVNQPTTQIYNRENSSFVPDYSKTPLVISPELYISGTSTSVINNITGTPKWTITTINGTINTNNGFIVPKWNPEALAKKMIYFMK